MDADIRSPSRRCYTFGPFAADCRKRLLWRGGCVVPLTPKAFEILTTLIEHRGRVLDKDELLERVWGDVAVEDATLAKHISTLRHALGERPTEHRYVVTVPGRGYEFVAGIEEIDEPPGNPSSLIPYPESFIPDPESRIPDLAKERGGRGEERGGRAEEPGARAGVRWPFAIIVVLAVAAAAALVFALVVRSSDERGTRSEARAAQRGLRQFTFGGGVQREPAWSPDGQWIAYTSDAAGDSDIWVQKVSADAQAFRVSPSPFEDSQPDWSPDGKRIVFRSERAGGGIYAAAVSGGGERRIADFGYRPKWSPSGSLVLFTSSGHMGGATRLYLVGVEGSAPRLLRPDLLAAFNVVDAEWKPDGGGVSVWGQRAGGGWTFITIPIGEGRPTTSGRATAVDRQIADGQLRLGRFVWSRSGRYLFFEGLSQGVHNLWRVTVDPSSQTWVAADRLTMGAGPEGDLTVSPDGTRLIFAARSSRTRLWSYPFDVSASRVLGPGEPMTSGGASEQDAESPADGTKVVYSATRGGRQEFWERTIPDGRERLLLSTTGWNLSRPRWSRDGLRLAYLRRRVDRTRQPEYAVVVLRVGGQERLLTKPGQIDLVPSDWSADGAWLLGTCRTGTPPRLGACVLPVSDGSVSADALRVVASDPTKNIFESRFSPDQRWISFMAVDRADARVSRVFVVPASGGAWRPITTGLWYDDKPHWSPDSRTLYFLSNRNGLFNLWARRFDPQAGVPVGEAFQITSFVSPRQTISAELSRNQIAVTPTHLFLPITESAAELWMLDNVDR